ADLGKPIKLELAPLGTIEGFLELGDFEKQPSKFKIEVNVADGLVNLLTVEVGSPKIGLKLPLGKYELSITAAGAEGINEQAELTSDETKYDLGKLKMSPNKANEAKGKPAPELTITDAQGISKNIKLADYKG